MAATDFVYDPTGESPDNLIVGEVHSLEHSAAVFPLHGAFFRERAIIEVSNNSNEWIPLEPITQYRYSPLWMRATAALGKDIHSFVIIYGEWKECRITYQTLGQFEDRDLLEQVASATFDRKDPNAWLSIRGCMSFNPIIRKPHWAEKTPLEVLSTGVEEILDEMRRLSGGNGKATLPQVTQLETRQTQLEDSFGNVGADHAAMRDRFDSIAEQFAQLEDFFENGWGGNTAYAGGYLYNSDTAQTVHYVNHNLNTEDVLTTFWAVNDDGDYAVVQPTVEVISSDQLRVTALADVKLLGVIEATTANGYIYSATDPETEYSIPHNLDSAFLRVELYARNGDGYWEKTSAPMDAGHKSILQIDLMVPTALKVIIEPPVSNSFIWGSDTPAASHLVHHRLSSLYLGASVWVRNADGRWVNSTVSIAQMDPGRLMVGLAESNDVRVVLSPIALEGPSWEQGLHTRTTHLEEKFDSLSNDFATLLAGLEDGTVGGGNIGRSHIYHEETPKTIHNVNHQLDAEWVSLTAWVKDPTTGEWSEYTLDYTQVDRDNLTITLTQAVALRVRVREEDS